MKIFMAFMEALDRFDAFTKSPQGKKALVLVAFVWMTVTVIYYIRKKEEN